MAYRFNGVDPLLRATIGGINGMNRAQPWSAAVLRKRNATGAWHGIHAIDTGGSSPFMFVMEHNPSNQLTGGHPTASWASAATFTTTASWEILAFTTPGTTGAGASTWRWQTEGGAWQSEAETYDVLAGTAGSGYRHLIGNEPGLGDDADMDIVCVGLLAGTELSQGQVESLSMASFGPWQAIFAGSTAWLMGFDSIATQVDRTGNGGDETARSGGITLVSDPTGWKWVGAVVDVDYRVFPKQKIRESIGVRR